MLINADSFDFVKTLDGISLTFFDPPFNQGKDYKNFDDKMDDEVYWKLIGGLIQDIYNKTVDGGSIYFMHREKCAEQVLRVLREAGWVFQNMIIWQKMTSAVPSDIRYAKSYQIIIFASKGKPKSFHKLKINPPLKPHQKQERTEGVFLTDVWDDIRELTSGYYAGEEALRKPNGERLHNQQAPVALLTRIIMASSDEGDLVLDPFAGTGTTAVVATQLKRNWVCIENNEDNCRAIDKRLSDKREIDSVGRFIYGFKRPSYQMELI